MFSKKQKYYYISYMVGTVNNMHYGAGTFTETGLPDLKRYIKEIQGLKENKDKEKSVIILSCIEVRADFI